MGFRDLPYVRDEVSGLSLNRSILEGIGVLNNIRKGVQDWVLLVSSFRPICVVLTRNNSDCSTRVLSCDCGNNPFPRFRELSSTLSHERTH